MKSLATVLISLAGWAVTSGIAASAQDAEFKASEIKKLVGKVQDYYALLDQDKHMQAKKELDKLQKDVNAMAKSKKVDDVLAFVPAWREIIRQGLIAEKPTVKPTTNGKFGSRPVIIGESPLRTNTTNAKALKGLFDGNIKAFASIPRDYKKSAFPVILALHPIADESGVSLKESMKSEKDLHAEVLAWLAETYPPEVLDAAIVVAPIMDFVSVNDSGLAGSRPQWNTDEGTAWALTALSQLVFKNVNYDPQRVFVDGHGSGSEAAILFCAQFPGLLAGAIVRNKAPNQVHFINGVGSAYLFCGDEASDFYDAQEKENVYKLTHMDALDGPALVAWIGENSKELCPKTVEIKTETLAFATSYWIQITDIDFTTRGNATIKAEANREKNEIVVTSNNKVKGFMIYLNDELVDISKPVKVIHKIPSADEEAEAATHVRFEGTKARVLEDALKYAYYLPHGNIGEVFAARIKVDL